jgi:hypothetical protein
VTEGKGERELRRRREEREKIGFSLTTEDTESTEEKKLIRRFTQIV